MTTHDEAPTPDKKNLDVKEVERHIEKGTQWVRLGDIEKSCVDGRDTKPVIGIPGGDSGLFVAMLATLEKVTGKIIDKDQLKIVFKNYQEKMGGNFYVHSDTHAEHAKHDVDHVGGNTNEECSCIGCGHLRLAMGGNKPEGERDISEYNDEYNTRPELVSEFFEMINEEIAQGNERVNNVILEGGHAEGAVVKIKTDSALTPDTMIPAITPCLKDEKMQDEQMFIYHEQVAEYMLDNIVKKIEIISGQDIDKSTFSSVLKDLFNQQLGATLQHLAKTKPVFEASISQINDKNEVKVEQLGVI